VFTFVFIGKGTPDKLRVNIERSTSNVQPPKISASRRSTPNVQHRMIDAAVNDDGRDKDAAQRRGYRFFLFPG
jgi:hypothetical protein